MTFAPVFFIVFPSTAALIVFQVSSIGWVIFVP